MDARLEQAANAEPLISFSPVDSVTLLRLTQPLKAPLYESI